jgi:hypothetical protein
MQPCFGRPLIVPGEPLAWLLARCPRVVHVASLSGSISARRRRRGFRRFAILHRVAEIVQVAGEIRVGDAPLPNVVNVLVRPTMLRMDRVEVTEIGPVGLFVRSVRDIAEVLGAAELQQPGWSSADS